MNTYRSKALEYSLKIVDEGLKTLSHTYPDAASINNIYPGTPNNGWTNGFWTGMLWLAYEFTGEEKYKAEALWQVDDFLDRIIRKIEVDHHDMGFLYSPSCVAAYKILRNETAKKAALMAADRLCGRFQEKGQFIQAWGELGAKESYRLIIDCMLNIPLLFWAYEVTGDDNYRHIAMAHLKTTMDVILREDFSTHHTYYFDPETGAPLYGVTHQGFSDDSIWARGQAWGVYGLAIAYKYTKDESLIDKFCKVTKVFLDRLPDDDIPAWDLIFTDTETQKDTSSAPIVVCGILEMARNAVIPGEFVKKAEDMLNALTEKCLTEDIANSNGILKHAVYSMPHSNGVDECNIWGDYYFMEALMRLSNPDWNSYWG